MHIQRIGPQAHDMEIGYRYEEGALVADGTPAPARDPMAGVYTPSTRPGSRLPHAVLEREGRRVSTHDLVRPDGFTLFCSRAVWRRAAASAARKAGIAIDVVQVGGRGARTPAWRDGTGTWARLREFGPGGAILVRPDAHVAWRAIDMPADPAAALAEIFEAIL